jgi:AcrR family transcriptional regulator
VDGKLSPGPGMPASDVAAHQSARVHRAMIEIVADRGYEAVKVRELVHLAGISTRAFYEHFDSKENCFLRTYDLVAAPAMRQLIAAQAGERDWRERPRLIFGAFSRELEAAPDAARFALVEAYLAGSAALELARRTEATFEAMLAESLARAPGGMVIPPMIIEGMVAGVSKVARTQLLAGRAAELAGMDEEMMEWALCYPGKFADELVDLDMQAVWRNTRLQPLVAPSAGGGEVLPMTGDRALILASVGKLTASGGYGSLSVSSIRRGAGVSRKVFNSHFDDVEGSFIGAMEHRTEEALAQAARAQAAGSTWSGGLYRAISALCDEISADPLLMGVCLADDFTHGSRASRVRTRLIAAVAGQLSNSASPSGPPSALVVEASAGASWALFDHHVIRALSRSAPQVAATLAFVALAPLVGAGEATAAIRGEQGE